MEPNIYLAHEHQINLSLIDSDALYVIDKLRDAGYTAYLVGGGVRDLLSSRRPKDFDISTSARPEEIKKVFGRKCLLIGRRFRLAHIRFGRKVFEVSTFRAGDPDCGKLIVQDNQWGTPEEDAFRRDFTINGLFYDPTHESVIDYVGGWEDLKKKTLRTIGNPKKRFQQDPVRMIRLLKFQARLGWDVEKQTGVAMQKCRKQVANSSPARIFEEFLRMLESGASAKFIELMQTHQFLELIFPCLSKELNKTSNSNIYQYLKSADALHLGQSPQTLERAVLLSCLIYPLLEREITERFLKNKELPNQGQITLVIGTLLRNTFTNSFSHFPKRLRALVGFILASQYRVTPLGRRKFSRHKLMTHSEFPMALRFFRVRTLVDPSLKKSYEEWRSLYHNRDHHSERRPFKKHPPKRIRKRANPQTNQ